MNISENFIYSTQWAYIRRAFWWYVTVASCVGILLNFYCVIILTRLKRHNARFTLLIIAFADLLALCLILGPHLGGIPRATDMAPIFCKVHTFLLHSASAYSVWCWVLWSIVRYMAVFHPIEHRRFRKCNNSCGLLSLLCICITLESWILITVDADAEGRCVSSAEFVHESVFQLLNLCEILGAYFFPFFCIVVTSLAIFVRIYMFSDNTPYIRGKLDSSKIPPGSTREQLSLSRSLSDNSTSTRVSFRSGGSAFHSESRRRRLRRRQFRSLVKLVILIVVSLTLNLPHCALRLLNTFRVYPDQSWANYYDIFQKISYALSYTHYAVNCIYLRLVVTVPKRPQKSMFIPKSSEETFSRIRTTM